MGANDALIHSQAGFKPKIFPIKGDVAPAEIDRAQSLDPRITMNREKIEELGRDGIVDYLKQTPTVGATLAQREYGSLEFFRKLANVSDATTSLTLNNFKTSYFDIVAYLEDDDGNFEGTLWYPEQRLTGFSITIGDPTAIIDRSFEFSGEKAKILQGDNKYLIYIRKAVESGDLDSADAYAVTLDDPSPVEDPDNAGTYILRIIRVRSGESTELASSAYSFSGPSSLTIDSAQIGDVYKIFYSAGSYITGQEYFTENDSDLAGILAHSASIYIGTSDYLYKLQSATIDVRFDREDVREIGNKDVVVRGIRNKTVTITLGKLLDKWTMEEVLRGVATDYGIIDISQFSSNLTLISAVYSDSTKSTFKLGFKGTSMSPTEYTPGTATIDAYVNTGTTIEGENLLITTVSGDLGI
jgi:hypothetical protein